VRAAPLGGRRLTGRIAALLARPGPWTYLEKHPGLELLYGARYSPHDNPVERIWAALKNYVANTAVSWPGRLLQIRSFSRNRPPDQILATAAPWTSPWLPPGCEQNFLNAALAPGGMRAVQTRTGRNWSVS
jgi:hypothetical protein